jgi:hypothetical protein
MLRLLLRNLHLLAQGLSEEAMTLRLVELLITAKVPPTLEAASVRQK